MVKRCVGHCCATVRDDDVWCEVSERHIATILGRVTRDQKVTRRRLAYLIEQCWFVCHSLCGFLWALQTELANRLHALVNVGIVFDYTRRSVYQPKNPTLRTIQILICTQHLAEVGRSARISLEELCAVTFFDD